MPQPPAPIIPTIPPAQVLSRLAALQTASTPELKAEWRLLFGTEPPAFNKRYLQDRLAYRVQELAYGGLKLETVARLEAIGERLDGGTTSCCAASAPTAVHCPARGWCATGRASAMW